MPLFVVVTKVDKSTEEQITHTSDAIFTNLLSEKGKVSFPVSTTSDVDIAVQNFMEGRLASYTTQTPHVSQCLSRVTPVFHISCVTGQNLSLLQRFLCFIPTETKPLSHKLLPAEFHVDELFNVEGVGLVMGGILKRGVVKEGEHLLIGPNSRGEFTGTIVKSIRYRINRAPCTQIVAGQAATITVSGVGRGSVRKVRYNLSLYFSVPTVTHPGREQFSCQRQLSTKQLTAVVSLRLSSSCWSHPVPLASAEGFRPPCTSHPSCRTPSLTIFTTRYVCQLYV